MRIALALDALLIIAAVVGALSLVVLVLYLLGVHL